MDLKELNIDFLYKTSHEVDYSSSLATKIYKAVPGDELN